MAFFGCQYYAQGMTIIMLDEQAATMDSMAFAERLKVARKASGMTQEQLARAVGITASAVSHLESGSSKSLSMDHIFACADALGVNAKWLSTGKGPRIGHDLQEAPSQYAIRLARLIEEQPKAKREALEALLSPE